MFLKFGASPAEFSVSTPETNPLFGNGAQPQVSGDRSAGGTLWQLCVRTLIAISLGVACHSKHSGGACYIVCSMDANAEANLRVHQEQEEEEGA